MGELGVLSGFNGEGSASDLAFNADCLHTRSPWPQSDGVSVGHRWTDPGTGNVTNDE
jgi:hypothetical protein